MENRKAKSQPSLPQRRWGGSSSIDPHSSSSSVVQRSHSMSAAHGRRVASKRDPLEQQVQRVARPMSSIPSSRPDSRAASRPSSRPGSRLGTRSSTPLAGGDTQEPLLPQRPKSGTVRPLSGRVFIRRTADKGWVAKHYPPPPAQSQEVDILDDVSDNDSLDSFFDDDFDHTAQGDKLQNLLSCNTLGVETKVSKPDYISGDVGLPKFHCPRCRDHWYGITPFPCDEELARLIREGLWYTGKGEPGEAVRRSKEPRFRTRPGSSSIKREHSNSGSSTSLTKLAASGGRFAKKSENSKGLLGSNDGKEKKKRITFKLDFEDSGSSGPSSTTLLQDDFATGYGRGGGKGILKGKSSGGGEGAAENGLGTSESIGDGLAMEQGAGSGKRGSGSGSGDALERGRKKGRRGGGGGGSSHDLESSSDGSGLSLDDGRRRGKRKKHDKTDAGMGISRNRNAKNGADGIGDGSLGKVVGMDSGHNKTQSRSDSGYNNSSLGSKSSMNGTDTNSEQPSSNRDPSSSHSDGLSNSGSNNSLSPTSTTSRVSRQGGGGERGGGRRLGHKDHGKNIRKAGGYMRAVSPTSSEWGDPLHARSFISSTATSRAGSSSNLLHLSDEEEDNDGGAPILPPIVVPPIHKKQVVDLSDLLDGFQFTRPWTFSYHNSGPITAKLTQRM